MYNRKEPDEREALIERNLLLVRYIANKFRDTETGMEDLISVGTIGLLKAVNTFQTGKQVKLATYASRCIENEILMYLRKNRRAQREISIDAPLRVDAEGRQVFLTDILGTEQDVIFRGVERKMELRRLARALSSLSPREQRVIWLRYGFEKEEREGRSQREVAELLGISQSYISRMEKRILCRLREEITKISLR